MSPRRRRALAVALHWGGALLATFGLVALTLVNGGQAPARADSTGGTYDQMSGSGSTASAISVPWTSGLLDSSNQPITDPPASWPNTNAERASGSGPYAFMTNGYTNAAAGLTNYGAFKNLVVTVSQTQDIGHAGITVKWTGGTQTDESNNIKDNFLQIMECYGNAATGPSPENCEFGAGSEPGSAAPLFPVIVQTSDGSRTGNLCSSQTLSTTNPTGALGANGGPCDPYEPAADQQTHFPCTPSATGAETGADCLGSGTEYNIPFIPADGSAPELYQGELGQAFDDFGTSEIDLATTRPDGSGQTQFETLTTIQSSGLGCGQPLPDGTPQGCWLVIVPRGVYEANGSNVATPGNNGYLQGSPLSWGNWAQRIQVHLDYAPLPNFCPLGAGRESLMEGSQLATRAVQSWELKLNQDAKCSLIYHLAETPEQQVTNDFSTPLTTGVPANGLAFTTVPVGDDRLRNGQQIPALPNIVYAPVAVVALDFGFHVDQTSQNPSQPQGFVSQAIKLSPQLLARALTQSYATDLPDYGAGSPPSTGPAWAQKNPTKISFDHAFQTLNPEVAQFSYIPTTAPLDTIDHSAYYQQIWQYLQGDPTASGWLDGAPDPTITIDPQYESQQLGKPPAIDSMPRSYTPCYTDPSTEQNFCSIARIPYVANFDAASAAVLAANPNNFNPSWDKNAISPQGTAGYWGKNPIEPVGHIFEWAIDATPYTAAYGLIPALLCDDSGGNCLGPTSASVTAAVNNAKPDSDGLLEVNPASPGAGAYPLTEVIYAAVRTDMPSQQLTDYANFISFAAGQGQAEGQAGGDLPAGYLPLTGFASLQAQATAAVTKLRQIAAGGPTSTGSPTPTGSGTTSSSSASTPAGSSGGPSTGGGTGTTSNNTSGGTTATTPAVAPNTGTSPGSTAPGASPGSGGTPTGPVIEPPTVAIAPAGNTPGQPVGPIRTVLAVVVIIGLGGAGAGILLRRGRLPRWPGGRGT